MQRKYTLSLYMYRLCAQRLLTAETQVTLTLSQPSPTAKSLTPHRTRHTSGHVSALRVHSGHTSTASVRPAARGLRSGPLRVVPRVFTRHAFHTLTTLALHRPRQRSGSISVITSRPLDAHATCTRLMYGSRTAAHTLCVRVPPLLRYLKCMHTLYVRVPPLFVSQMYMLTYKRTEHHVRY